MIDKKTEIRGTVQLMSFLKKNSPKNIGIQKKGLFERKNRVIRKTFRNFSFHDDMHDIEFLSVKFIDCDFVGIFGFYCLFRNCEFQNCNLRNCRFTHMEDDWNGVYFINSQLRNVELDEGCVFNLTFGNCLLISCNVIGLNPAENLRFYNSRLESSHFEGLFYYEEENVLRDDEFIDLLFEDCILDTTNFNSINLKNSRFRDTILYKSGFIDCYLDDQCIQTTKKLQFESYATMDFQTILQSDELNDEILAEFFNIKNRVQLKDIISGMTTAKTFSTVFISYSFKDYIFANRINDALNRKGIRTFMWQKDAPGGKPLEEIMTAGITAHDKLLFIASENSIKSKACQYELTTARIKQEASWENVFFPITIDDYLFKVKKSQIRPMEQANEYSENIEEIKRVNALDFSEFNNRDFEEKDFELAFDKITDGLRIGT
ncbi:MAG: TIR domain-containing protein [Flavipsychrobacter sp.]|nr:TIR domain-containing protein [Flavipsychrobacter sp.]